tara:strand:- start:43829 stop:44035 length:207 start_codon:yes stop_codon:yes gene_type:complete
MNEEFAPASEDVYRARCLLVAYESALRENRGAVQYEGKSVDAPVVARAREILAMHERISSRNTAADVE